MVKIIWRIIGLESFQLSNHYMKHILDYCEINNIKYNSYGINKINDYNYFLYIIVNNKYISLIKKDLNPTKILYNFQ